MKRRQSDWKINDPIVLCPSCNEREVVDLSKGLNLCNVCAHKHARNCIVCGLLRPVNWQGICFECAASKSPFNLNTEDEPAPPQLCINCEYAGIRTLRVLPDLVPSTVQFCKDGTLPTIDEMAYKIEEIMICERTGQQLNPKCIGKYRPAWCPKVKEGR